jgi:dihydropteroate synthase
MRLSLGATRYDLAARALVVGIVGARPDVGRQARDLVAAGADVVDLGRADAASDAEECDLLLAALAEARAAVDVPLCLGTTRPAVASAAAAAGAAMVDVGGPDTVLLGQACLGAGAVAVVSPGADAAGFDPSRVVVRTGDVAQARRLASSGRAVLLDVPARCRVAAMAAGVVLGARLLRTDDVREARRVCDVLAAVWGAGR